MWRFLIDEDMPRSTFKVLRSEGYEADDVRDLGLRGQDDAPVFAYAQSHEMTVVSCDNGFSNVLNFPLGKHAGIIVVRVPDELPTHILNRELLRSLRELEGEALAGILVIVEVGRTRVRRPTR